MPPGATDPSVHRRRLRSELRKAREAAGMTQKDVAAAMDWSSSKLIRIETGAVKISTNDLKALLNHYGTTDEAGINTLVELARRAREPSWWASHREVATPQLIEFLGYESSASIVRNYEPIFVPGLLQTEEYAREVLKVTDSQTATTNALDSLVDLRMERQELLERDDSPEFHFILDEAVLCRQVGGTAIMRRQILQLREASERPRITVRVVPFRYGAYSLCRTSYVILEFPDPVDGNIVFIENPLGESIYREDPSDEEDTELTPTDYLGTFFRLEQDTGGSETVQIMNAALLENDDRTSELSRSHRLRADRRSMNTSIEGGELTGS
jgi:transcriptional regulator with XRE-family HTH domain